MVKSNKGFTLTELLVVIAILGIITGMSIPLIRNLSDTFEDKKYSNYADSVLASAKLFNDSYSEDLFGHNEYGCAYVTFEQLVDRDLLKDIDVDNVSCNSNSTFVRIIKQRDKYGYSAYLGCGKKNNGVAESIDISRPEKGKEYIMNTEYCTGVEENNLLISADTTWVGNDFNKKRKTTRLKITSGTGIENSVAIYTGWSKSESSSDVTNWEKASFKIIGNQKQRLLDGEVIEANSNELITPEGESGTYYLIVRVDNLKDLYGNRWKNPNDLNSNYLSYGPFSVDNEKPTITASIYKCDSSHAITGNSLKSKTVTGTGLLELKDITGNVSGWLNKSNYEYGVCLKYEVTDNIAVKSVKSEWNSSGIKNNATGYKTLDGGNSTQTYTDNKSSQVYTTYISADGHRYIRLTVKDNAGNESYIDVDAKIDKTGPTCGTATGASTSWTKNDRTIKQLCNDAISECVKSSYDTKYTSSKTTDTVTIADNAGNTATCTYNVYVDKNPPTCGTATGASTSWTKSDRTIKQACSDTGGSGCAKTSYDTTYKTTKKTDTITISDAASNTATCTYNVYVDKNPPTCGTVTGASTSWTKSDRTVKQACSDTGGSGCAKTSYDTTYKTTKKTDTITISDAASNTATCTYNVYVDKDAPDVPTITNPSKENWTKNDFALTLKSDDHGQSGISYYQYTYSASASATGTDNTKNWVTYANSASTSFVTTNFSAERNQLVYVRVCDSVGNCSNKSSTYIRIDKTGPEYVGFSYESGLIKDGEPNYYPNTTFIFSCSDSGSGTNNSSISITKMSDASVGYGSRSGPDVLWTPAVGDYFINEKCIDNVGNSTTKGWEMHIKNQSSSSTSCGYRKKLASTYTAKYCSTEKHGKWIGCGNTTNCNTPSGSSTFCGIPASAATDQGCCFVWSCS